MSGNWWFPPLSRFSVSCICENTCLLFFISLALAGDNAWWTVLGSCDELCQVRTSRPGTQGVAKAYEYVRRLPQHNAFPQQKILVKAWSVGELSEPGCGASSTVHFLLRQGLNLQML